jgi:hypothetical protein
MNKTVVLHWIAGFAFGFGILLAGSDGVWFPWTNFAGVLLVLLAMLCARADEKATAGSSTITPCGDRVAPEKRYASPPAPQHTKRRQHMEASWTYQKPEQDLII